jgi:hypothetical protein
LSLLATSSCSSIFSICKPKTTSSATVIYTPGTKTSIKFNAAWTGCGPGTYSVSMWAQGVDQDNNSWGAVTPYPFSLTVS